MFLPYLTDLFRHEPALAALATLVMVIVAGTTAQILANRARIPATGPLLIAGLVLGPAVLGLIVPDLMGEGLRVVVRAAVAVVVFEGGLLLDVREIRHASRAVIGLVTVGLLITTVLAGIASRHFIGWSWEMSILFGSIVSVTGPTVIQPILQKVRVNRRVRVTLQSESIIADPLGVILAAVIFTAVTSPGGWQNAGPHALRTLGIGAGIGLVVAGSIWLTARRFQLLPAQFARLAILGAALTAYTLAELLAHESGVLAVAITGMAVGSFGIPHKEEVEQFKGDLASLAISAVFILLAAGLSMGNLADLGWGGVAVVALIMLVIRPVRVFLSTMGSELQLNEKGFISFVGPRGIVAASVAAFFALRLTDTGHKDGGALVALVFAVILATVLIEGSGAGLLARWFKVMPQHTIIVGADDIGRILAEDLGREREDVTLIDTNKDTLSQATDLSGVQVLHADATDAATLKKAGAADAKCLIAATSSDKVNLLICELARATFKVPRLMARVTDLKSAAAFESAGIETVLPSRAAARVFRNLLLRPSLYRAITEGGGAENIMEVTVRGPAAGESLAQLKLEGVVVVAVRRDGKLIAPSGATRLETADVVTLLGDTESLAAARRRLLV
jgi:NhaP-type Na+/H+ or K+/H+ antiporter/Trk K+ transport system NAD-binding subunit